MRSTSSLPKVTISFSMSDLPMMELSEKAFLVDGEHVKEIDIKEYKSKEN